MNAFKIQFKGRLVGSIGAFQNFEVIIAAKDAEDALRKLYGTHEHISQPIVTEVSK